MDRGIAHGAVEGGEGGEDRSNERSLLGSDCFDCFRAAAADRLGSVRLCLALAWPGLLYSAVLCSPSLSWTLIYDSAQLGASWRVRLNSFSNCPRWGMSIHCVRLLWATSLWYVLIRPLTPFPFGGPSHRVPGLITREIERETCKFRISIGISNVFWILSRHHLHAILLGSRRADRGRSREREVDRAVRRSSAILIEFTNDSPASTQLTLHSWQPLCRWQLRAVPKQADK